MRTTIRDSFQHHFLEQDRNKTGAHQVNTPEDGLKLPGWNPNGLPAWLCRKVQKMGTKGIQWFSCCLMALFGGLLRFIRLGSPGTLVFDETYYVKDAWTMLVTGEARNWPKTIRATKIPIDQAFAQGQVNLWLDQTEYVVHPPLGKWCIALGLKLFGGATNPFAWRAATAIAGTLAILLLCRIALRLFHNLPIALMAGFLMSIDGMGIVMSRTGLLDNFIMVFTLASMLCLLGHHDWALDRLKTAWEEDRRYGRVRYKVRSRKTWKRQGVQALVVEGAGPFIAWSWWRTGAAILLGLATATKWSGAYFFAVFALISVLLDGWERHQVGYGSWLKTVIYKDGLPAALVMIPVWAGTYLASWSGWFMHGDSYMHNWAINHPGQGLTWLPEGLRSLVQYHLEMWRFHTSLDTPHPYMANPLTWPLQIRPTSFYWRKISGHPGLCAISPNTPCVEAITSLGNPLTWWLGSVCMILAIIVCIFIQKGDWRIWIVLAGMLGGWLPWIQYLHRTTFTFYAIVILPWIILAISYMTNWVRENTTRAAYRQMIWTALIIVGLTSLLFYPIWTAIPVPYWFWHFHMWLPSWI